MPYYEIEIKIKIIKNKTKQKHKHTLKKPGSNQNGDNKINRIGG